MDHFCEIEIPGKFWQRKRRMGLLFDLYAWMLLYKEFGWDFEAMATKSLEELSNAMLYTGAVSWSRNEGRRVDFTQADMQRWADELPAKKLREISKVLTESMSVINEMRTPGESKKK